MDSSRKAPMPGPRLVLTQLTRVAQRRVEMRRWLEEALSRDFGSLSLIALDVAIETGDPIGQVLASLIEKNGSLEWARSVEARCSDRRYRNSIPLREAAAISTQVLLDKIGDHDVDAKELLRIKSDYALRLGAVNRNEKALEIAKEVVGRLRTLSSDGSKIFLRDLGRNLVRLSVRYSALDQRDLALETALESVRVLNKFILENPGDSAVGLVQSLHNLAACLRVAGRHEEALRVIRRVVEIQRRLRDDHGEIFSPGLAAALNDLGLTCSDLEHRERSLRAMVDSTSIRRQLAIARPDVYLPVLAASLHDLSVALCRLDRHDEALDSLEEAAEIWTRLANERADVFLPDLAASQNNLSLVLSALKRHDEALYVVKSAVDIYDRLRKERGDLFLHYHAMSLNNLGESYKRLGRKEDAAASSQQEVSLYRRIANQEARAFLHDLASSRSEFGYMIGDLGLREKVDEIVGPILDEEGFDFSIQALGLSPSSSILDDLGVSSDPEKQAEVADSVDHDIFISYNHENEDYAHRINDAMKVRGLRAWVDRREILPGRLWQKEIEKAILGSRSTAVLIGKGGLGPWQEMEMLVSLKRLVEHDIPVIPVILPECPEEDELPLFLQQVGWVDMREIGFKDAMSRLEQAVLGVAPEYSSDGTIKSDDVRELSEELEGLLELRARRSADDRDVSSISKRILEIRRTIREGGTLRPGDFLSGKRYRVVAEVGEGGYGRILRAYDGRGLEVVAIKVLHGQYSEDRSRRERFFRGARRMARLNHEGVVRVVEEECRDGSFYFYVMEYVSAGTFRDAVLEKRLFQEECLGVILRVGEALAYAHGRGLVHRDVKPSNILIDGNGRPKLTDFELVYAQDTTGGTRSGLGSIVYGAPESLSGESTVTAAADVYGLAMTTIFSLYGEELPYVVVREAESILDSLRIKKNLRSLLFRSIDWNPRGRPQSVREFCSSLRDCW